MQSDLDTERAVHSLPSYGSFLNLLPLYPSGQRTTTETRSSFVEHSSGWHCHFMLLALYGLRHSLDFFDHDFNSDVWSQLTCSIPK